MTSLTFIEVALLLANDEKASERTRGIPSLKTYAPPVFLGQCAWDITHDDFKPILAQYREGRPSTETGYRLIAEYNAVLRWAADHGYHPLPFKPFPLPTGASKKDELLSVEAMEAIVDAADSIYGDDITVSIAIRALAWLALGVSETANFSLSSIDYKRWEYIQKDRAGRLRYIPIPKEMQALIARARHLKPNGGSHKRKSFKWLSDQGIRDIVRRVGEHCGLPGLLPCQIVHTCIFG